MWCNNIARKFFGLVTSTRMTDGQTDGQNYESQDRASIVASRGKNVKKFLHLWSGPRHVIHIKFSVPNHISGKAIARVVKFCTQIGYIKLSAL